MLKLLIGGSPCTNWSIAKKEGRETKPEGIGWELFKNYLIAKEKFQPDFFLYENNKSAAQAIKDQIAVELGVETDPKVRFTYINSALVSAQNRQRFYVTNFGDIEQPKNRGILLKDILENGCDLTSKNKSFALTASYDGAVPWNTIERSQRSMVAESVYVAQRGRYPDSGNRSAKGNGPIRQFYEARTDGKTNALTTVSKDNAIAESVCVGTRQTDKSRTLTAMYHKKGQRDFKQDIITNGRFGATGVIEPIRIGTYPNKAKNQAHDSKQYRIYSVDGKSTALCGNGGGMGAKTGLYAIPVEFADGVPIKAVSSADGKTYSVYEVKGGQITVNGAQYPIKLIDGYYIIRKLTVTECCRLQTLPDNYCKAVSATQAYKGLGNGWTAEVIIHLLGHALKDVPRDEKLVVLSMYDGIGTGRYCLDKMGFKNVKYYAYEIDKYAMTVANDNYPDIIQCGDAFAVRDDGWRLESEVEDV